MKLPLLFVALMLPVASWAQPPALGVPAANVDDWTAYGTLEKQLKGAEAQTAIEAWRKFFESRPQLQTRVSVNVTMRITELYSDKLKDKQKALEIDDWAIKKYADTVEIAWPLWHKSKTLSELKRPAEAAKVWEENWDALVRSGQSSEEWLVMYAATVLREANDAYDALGQGEKAIPMLLKAFDAMPALYDDKEQGQGDWKDGWMFSVLINKLIRAGRAADALRWAKLHYALGSFDKDVLARANTNLGKVWGENEEYQKIRVFALMQDEGADPTLKNPLAEVSLPPLDDKQLKEHMARLQLPAQGALPRYKTKELIGVLLANGDFGGAMNVARRLMKDDPAKPDGALQICRIFKAADNSTRRANQYLLFLDGKAENPIPAFLKEFPAK